MTAKHDQLAWGIIGPGAIAHNFAAGLSAGDHARLVAVAGRDQQRRNSFAAKYDIPAANCHPSSEQLLADSAVQAVYIATPHPAHAQLAIDALRAGKHVLCEKPAGLNAAEVRAMVDCAANCGRFFMEGFMYLCHPQIARAVELVTSGHIGTIVHIDAALCFAAPYDPQARLFNPQLAGGAILDVGCYPISFARLIAGAAQGRRFAEPLKVKGVAYRAPSNVDGISHALLEFANGLTAQCAAAVMLDQPMHATIYGSKGHITLPDPWIPGRDAGPADAHLIVTVNGQEEIEEFKFPDILFALEAECASVAILAGALEAPAPLMGWQDSIGNAQVLQDWRTEIGLEFDQECLATNRALTKVITKTPPIPLTKIAGVEKPVARFIMGCDNQERDADAAVIWDAWLEAGGNAFDTAWIYGAGLMEGLLGKWLAARGVRDEVVLIVKGAHTPCCDPVNLRLQLEQSLDRLGISKADIYIMHRDNPAIPVGEFVDALNELRDAGLIGVTGGSNWSLQRWREANDWAAANERQPLTILNNNLSLAVMEKPIWPGCVSANNQDTLAFLRTTDTVHLSWSSQARGYFLPAELRDRLPEAIGPENCFGSTENAERRRRATLLAQEKGVSPTNIAAAWVINQPFPSFALIGPRRPLEIATSLPALHVELSPNELEWLNLVTDQL